MQYTMQYTNLFSCKFGLIFTKSLKIRIRSCWWAPFKELGLPMFNKSEFMDGDISPLFEIDSGNGTYVNVTLFLFGGATGIPMVATMLLFRCCAAFKLVTKHDHIAPALPYIVIGSIISIFITISIDEVRYTFRWIKIGISRIQMWRGSSSWAIIDMYCFCTIVGGCVKVFVCEGA